MNEEIEYAEMLEIPVSTVNVVKKTSRRKKTTELPARKEDGLSCPLKDTVIAQVNNKISNDLPKKEIVADADLFAEAANGEGNLVFDPIPDRIDTVRLYSHEETKQKKRENKQTPQLYNLEDAFEFEEEPETEEPFEQTPPSRGWRIALGVEFAAACALCGAIFLTNVFFPNSAVNTFFRSINNTNAQTTDTRTYADFTLSPVVSEQSDATLTLSENGVLSFTDKCCVYPSADGTVQEVSMDENGAYRIKISHSDSFSGVISGLDYVYYAAGETVKSNVPVGYSEGNNEVQVTMYSDGELLNCFLLTEENCLAWANEN